jgi:hypothetical protein
MWSPGTVSILIQRLNQAYAWLFGYFWLPCPLCGRYFGGHQEHGRGIPADRPGIYRMTCKRHR